MAGTAEVVEPVGPTEGDMIKTKPILDYFQGKWGITPSEYLLGSKDVRQVDFQDLMVNVTERQALAIEQEVKPSATRIQRNTKRLKKCGDGMAEFTEFKFDTSKDPDPWATGPVSAETAKLVNELAKDPNFITETGKSVNLQKHTVDAANQFLKTESDRLNNIQQLAMSRMESLVQSRDQNFSTATTLMNHVSEARGNTIRSMG